MVQDLNLNSSVKPSFNKTSTNADPKPSPLKGPGLEVAGSLKFYSSFEKSELSAQGQMRCTAL